MPTNLREEEDSYPVTVEPLYLRLHHSKKLQITEQYFVGLQTAILLDKNLLPFK